MGSNPVLTSAAMRTAFAWPRAAVSACSASAEATAPDARLVVSLASHGVAEMMFCWHGSRYHDLWISS